MSDGALETTLVREPAALRELGDDWRRLAAERGNAFLTPEWTFAALETVDRGATPVVPVVRERGGALLGLLPLVTDRGGALRFAGARPADRLHPVAAEGDEERVAAAAGETLATLPWRRRWLRLDRVDSEAGWPRALANAGRPALRAVAQPADELPYIPLAGLDYDAFMATRSRGLRSQVGRRMRGLRKEHEVGLRTVEDRGELEAALDELFRLHDLRTEGSGRVSSFDRPAVREHHRRFVTAALERGWLRLCLLEVDDRPIAAWYGWSLGGRYAYYQAGFDPQWSRSSPGMLLLAETIRMATEEGASEYDLLRGDEPFKRRFADHLRHGRTLVLAPAGHPALIRAAAANRLRRTWRRVPERARNRLLRGRG